MGGTAGAMYTMELTIDAKPSGILTESEERDLRCDQQEGEH